MSRVTNEVSLDAILQAVDNLPGKEASLRTRAELMQKIVEIIKKKRWDPAKAATQCRITQARMNDLLRGRLANFSFDALLNIAAAIGYRAHVELKTTP